jgi:hypothetical protein
MGTAEEAAHLCHTFEGFHAVANFCGTLQKLTQPKAVAMQGYRCAGCGMVIQRNFVKVCCLLSCCTESKAFPILRVLRKVLLPEVGLRVDVWLTTKLPFV